MIIKKPRGTYDLFGQEMELYNKICEELKSISKSYNCSEIKTPIFEHKELFVRNIGEASDIVTKEFYDFKDKSDRDLALRPENTVGVIRSVIENKLLYTQPLPLKFFYIGPMFRYERPQSGRNRQFHQFGIEFIGTKNLFNEVEGILFAIEILKKLNIQNWKLKVNYIGSLETRQKWINALKSYFKKYEKDLTEDSKNRIEKNPLRILDDKVDGSKTFVKNCPKIEEFLSNEEKEEFKSLHNYLKNVISNFELDDTLVRGLDYYSGLVFEFVSTSEKLKGQSTIIGGGRYAKLTKELGDDDYVCFGFALGIERLILAYCDENNFIRNNSVDIYVAAIGSIDSQIEVLKFVNQLRSNNFSVEANFDLKKIDKQFKNSNKYNPAIILVYGDEEHKNKKVSIKNQLTSESKIVDLKNINDEITKIFFKQID